MASHPPVPGPQWEAFQAALTSLGVQMPSTWGVWILLANLDRRLKALEERLP